MSEAVSLSAEPFSISVTLVLMSPPFDTFSFYVTLLTQWHAVSISSANITEANAAKIILIFEVRKRKGWT